jgi:hypothetical protein
VRLFLLHCQHNRLQLKVTQRHLTYYSGTIHRRVSVTESLLLCLIYLACKTSQQRIDLSTTECFTAPVKKSYNRNKDFRVYSYKYVALSPDFCLKKTPCLVSLLSYQSTCARFFHQLMCCWFRRNWNNEKGSLNLLQHLYVIFIY